jgi:ACT domain-containing protein
MNARRYFVLILQVAEVGGFSKALLLSRKAIEDDKQVFQKNLSRSSSYKYWTVD